jgi:hypothetical protein
MIGKSNKEMLLQKLDVLTRVGLQELATEDLQIPKYTCMAIQQIFASKRQKGCI